MKTKLHAMIKGCYANQFYVRPNHFESVEGTTNNIYYLNDGDIFSLILGNDRSVKANAYVKFQGENVGAYRIEPFNTYELDGPSNIDGVFQLFSSEESAAQFDKTAPWNPELCGLVEVKFKWEKPDPIVSLHNPANEISLMGQGPEYYRRESYSASPTRISKSGTKRRSGKNTAKSIASIGVNTDYQKHATYAASHIKEDPGEVIIYIRLRAITVERHHTEIPAL